MIYAFIYQFFVIWLAKDNAQRIEAGKRIYHGLNGGLHLLASCLVLPTGWINAICLLLLTRVVFDLSLNSFRNLPFDYVTHKPKSIVDKLERKVFGKNGWMPKVIYVLLFICLQTLK